MQTPWGECDIADAHVHFFSRRFFAALGEHCRIPAHDVAAQLHWELPPDNPVELAQRWGDELDKHGVAGAALVASIPEDEASTMAATVAHPDRFFAFAMVN